MIRSVESRKITAKHLRKKAYLYVRQSTLRQVIENRESTERQYALRQRALALGWPDEQIEVIDHDMGLSAASQKDREGFKRLVGEIGMGYGGLVMGLEVSRLARCCSDWHKLLEICALTETLILDEDGIYDPAHYNDRLLLGMKGSMSEAELHILKARLQGGLLNKARKGELYKRLPTGYVHNEEGKIIMDPDLQIRQAIMVLFDSFQRFGSANRTVQYFYRSRITFPCRQYSGPDQGKVVWKYLTNSRIANILHNPCYAGAYVFGRRRRRKDSAGDQRVQTVAADQWHAFLPSSHAGYITWEQYLENQKQLQENRNGSGDTTAAREGNALLQSLAICGKCGRYMMVRYQKCKQGFVPTYICAGAEGRYGGTTCQRISGKYVDEIVSRELCELMRPSVLEVSLNVQKEVEARIEDVEKLFKQQVMKARYDADLARRRYMQVDPDNRLVAGTLEEQWNEKLASLKQAEDDCQKRMRQQRDRLEENSVKEVMRLAADFGKFWEDERIENKERKRLVRLMIEDVTLTHNQRIKIQIRFRGGAVKSIDIPHLQKPYQLVKTAPEVISEVDALLNSHTYAEAAEILNERRLKTGQGNHFNERSIKHILRRYNLKTRGQRLKEKGLKSLSELARIHGTCRETIKRRIEKGLLNLKRHKINDRNPPDYMYENPNPPQKYYNKDTGGAL